MLKQAIFVVLQMILFLVIFGAGSFLPAIGALPKWKVNVSHTHDFVFDGLLFMLLAYLVILGIEAARKRLRISGGLTTLAFVLALALGFAVKFGLVSIGAGAS